MTKAMLQGLYWGLISAASLPMGAWIGLSFNPNPVFRACLMAFGAGALLFASLVAYWVLQRRLGEGGLIVRRCPPNNAACARFVDIIGDDSGESSDLTRNSNGSSRRASKEEGGASSAAARPLNAA